MKEIEKSAVFKDNQQPTFDTSCRIDVRNAEEEATLVIELHDKNSDGDTHISSVEIDLEDLTEYANEGLKEARMLDFAVVPGGKDSWDEGKLKIQIRDGKKVKLTMEEKAKLKKKKKKRK